MTIFKKIINREIPAEIVYEDSEILAFKDISPQAPVHILIIPKQEIISIQHAEACDALLIGKMMIVASKIATEMGFAQDGYRVVTNIGQHGGQSVYHLHLHLLAGRQLSWPPG
jgi:histidine triad (HIT) family protein